MSPRDHGRTLANIQIASQIGRIRHLIRQGFRFGLVGGLSTIVHVAVFIFCIELLGVQPFWANIPAFCVAFAVGFVGHFSWTFSRTSRSSSGGGRSRALIRFAAVSGIGLSLNATIVFLIVNVAGQPYFYAVALMVSLVPVIIFVLSRHWAFA